MGNESEPQQFKQGRVRGWQQTTLELPTVPDERKRRRNARIATATLATVGASVCMGIPLIASYQSNDISSKPPGNSDIFPTRSSPTPILSPPSKPQTSLCEIQEGTFEAQLPYGEPELPATSDRPSIFVVSPDGSFQQTFAVKVANDHKTDWNRVTQDVDVGIVGIATSDIIFDATEGLGVWGKSCEPSRDVAEAEVEGLVNDLCNSKDLGLREVVVYQVGQDGVPEVREARHCW